MEIKPFVFSPVTVKTIYGTIAKGVLLVRFLEDNKISKLFIFENDKWIKIELNQVEKIEIRIIEEDEIVNLNNDSLEQITLKPNDVDIIRQVVASRSYTVDLT